MYLFTTRWVLLPWTCSNLFILKHVRLASGRLASDWNALLFLIASTNFKMLILIPLDPRITLRTEFRPYLDEVHEGNYFPLMDIFCVFVAYSFECDTGNIDLVNEAYSVVNDAFYYASVVYDMYRDIYWTFPLRGKIIARYVIGQFKLNEQNGFYYIITAYFGQGNIFRSVCHSFCPLGGCLYPGRSVSRVLGFVSKGLCIQGVCIRGGLNPLGFCIQGRLGRPPIGYYVIWPTSGRYASYWNAF